MVPPKDGFAQSSPHHNNNCTSSITYKRKTKVLENEKHLPSPNNLKYITTKPLNMLLPKHNNTLRYVEQQHIENRHTIVLNSLASKQSTQPNQRRFLRVIILMIISLTLFTNHDPCNHRKVCKTCLVISSSSIQVKPIPTSQK